MSTLRSARPVRATVSGFTLVEVMVALVVLALVAAMAFRGIDQLMRARDRTRAETDHTLALDTAVSQFDYDVSQIVNTRVVEPAAFDGTTLRLTRRAQGGVQLVLWTLQDHRWMRWASAPLSRVPELQQAWLNSQQWSALAPTALTLVSQVTRFQAYSYCSQGGWGNFQSSCGTVQVSATPPGGSLPSTGAAPAASGASSGNGGPGTTGGTVPNSEGTLPPAGLQPMPDANGQAPAGARSAGSGDFPTGIRIELELPEGLIMRERELPTL